MMFDTISTLTALHLFVQDHEEALQNAALLLGGQFWLRRTQRLIDDLRGSQRVSRRVRDEARAVLGLLSLENVCDDMRLEAGLFAQLDPSAPYVEEICLLVEAFAEALMQEQSFQLMEAQHV